NRTPIAGNVLSPILINSMSAMIARLIPAPNLPGFADNLVSNVPYRLRGNKADGRIDQHFSDRTAFFLRYGYTNDWSFNGSPLGNVISAATRGRLVGQNVVADVNHEVTHALITDFRFGYNRYDQKLNLASDQSPLFAAGFSALPGINIAGFQPIGPAPYLPEHGVDNTFNWVWSWNWHRANHNVK